MSNANGNTYIRYRLNDWSVKCWRKRRKRMRENRRIKVKTMSESALQWHVTTKQFTFVTFGCLLLLFYSILHKFEMWFYFNLTKNKFSIIVLLSILLYAYQIVKFLQNKKFCEWNNNRNDDEEKKKAVQQMHK